MNGLMSRKKKYRFQVDLKVAELQHVPFLSQELYVKVRLLQGGFTHHSQSLVVENHVVRWNQSFKFTAKMSANASTGELDSCICRVSVRQEIRGGKSFQKLGYADVNLAQFAGSGGSNIYLLEAYDSKHRLHNSTLRVHVDMTLLSGDPCFKAQSFPRSMPSAATDGVAEDRASEELTKTATGSITSLPSLGYSSLDKKTKAGDHIEPHLGEQTGHSRNSSNTSGSGYVSNASASDKSGGHVRNGSHGSGGAFSEGGSLERPVSATGVPAPSGLHASNSRDPRVVSTREDAHDMIDQIFQDNIGTIKPEDVAETSGLHLYIREDGTASVSGHAICSNGDLKRITDKR